MTPNPIASAALAYAGARKERRETTGPMTDFGRDAPTAQSAERKPEIPERP